MDGHTDRSFGHGFLTHSTNTQNEPIATRSDGCDTWDTIGVCAAMQAVSRVGWDGSFWEETNRNDVVNSRKCRFFFSP